MSQDLRQSTQIVVHIGPFVDVGDGFTPETGITLSGADEAELLKAGATSTTDISGATWAAITGCDGWYALTLTTSLTDTLGTLEVIVQDDSVCLPVHARFNVMAQAAYDALYSTGNMPSDMKAISGNTDAADNLADGADVLARGTVSGSGSTSTVIDTTLSGTNVAGRVITFKSGTLAKQSRRITADDGSGELTVDPAFTGAPADTNAFVIS